MSREEQVKFVDEMSRTVASEVIRHIKMGKVPDTWDGHELRALLARAHKASADMTLIHRERRSRRARSFLNHVMTNNL